jgi:filamentous hemagglutinin family protein
MGALSLSWWHENATAQIIPDDTLGSEISTIQPQSPLVDTINGGAIRGTTLFHSFREFNIDAGRSVYFINPAGVNHIISRVTGTNPSQILGTLGVSGKANLLLINPQGIIFGANAKLDVRGSFIGSTASSVLFAEGVQFSAVNPQTPPLLNIQVPIGLQFENFPGAISLDSARLVMQPDQTLALVGGNVSLNNTNILAPGGRVELGGLVQTGTIILNSDGSFTYPGGVQRGDVAILNNSQMNVRASGGGSITVYGENVLMNGGSKLRAGIASGMGEGGNITIDATGKVTLTDTNSFISNAVLANTQGRTGDVNITAASLVASQGFQIFAGTYGQGDVGNVNINVRESMLLDGIGTNGINTGVYNSITDYATGKGGNVNIVAQSLSVTNGAVIEATTVGRGNAGNINIFVHDTALFDGEIPDFSKAAIAMFSSGVYSRVSPFAVGNAGNINIRAATVQVSNGAVITSSTDGRGNAGNVIINANQVKFIGEGRFNSQPGFGFFQSSGAFSSVKNRGQGIGGNVIVNANTFNVNAGAVVVTSTRGRGNAGDILINGADSVNLLGVAGNGYASGLYSNTEPRGIGKGGRITVNTRNLRLADGAVINALTANAGDGGSIFINSGNLEITEGSQILTSTRGAGNAGDINLNIQDRVTLTGKDIRFSDRASAIAQIGWDTFTNQGAFSGVLANTDVNSTGNGGNIFLHSGQLNLQNHALITVSSQGVGMAGNIDVTSRTIQLANQGAITAETTSADGGNISLTIGNWLLMRHNSLISTTAGTGQAPGNGGNIKIDASNGFIIAVPHENSDIIANAFAGKGGVVDINSYRLLGFTLGAQLTPQSEITAFSQTNPQLHGVVAINTFGIDPTQGIISLPTQPGTVEVSEGCKVKPSTSQQLRFVNLGHGGTPPPPEELSPGKMFVAGWIDLDEGDGVKGIGHWALGIGHWALGIGHWALGIGHGVWGCRGVGQGVDFDEIYLFFIHRVLVSSSVNEIQ